jgi:hypothetical protein
MRAFTKSNCGRGVNYCGGTKITRKLRRPLHRVIAPVKPVPFVVVPVLVMFPVVWGGNASTVLPRQMMNHFGSGVAKATVLAFVRPELF